MACPTYTASVVVIGKRALGEADLVLSLLDGSGAKISAVAKGARKPTSPFSSRLELFSRADVLLARGRSLDIVKEARLVDAHERLRADYGAALAASIAADALDHLAQEGLPQARIFPMTEALLGAMDASDPQAAPALAAAFLLKALATFGFRPILSECALCGRPVGGEADEPWVPFSVREGGVLCPACASRAECQPVDGRTAAAARFLMGETFARIADAQRCPSDVTGVLHLVQLWMQYHTGLRLRSIDQLLRNGSGGAALP